MTRSALVLALGLVLGIPLTLASLDRVGLDPSRGGLSTAAAAEAPEVEAVARELMDPCENCRGKLLSACDCTPAAELKDQIRARLDRGESKEQIVAAIVAEQGEWIRAAPPKRGFNLIGWGLPFALIFLGAIAIVLFLRRSVRRGDPLAADGSAGVPAPDPSRTALLERRPGSPPDGEAGPSGEAAQWRRRLANELEQLDG